MKMLSASIAVAFGLCATAAQAADADHGKAAQRCEDAVAATIERVRGKDVQDVQFIGAKRAVTADGEDLGVKGEGRYRRNGGGVPFTYSCAVNEKTGKRDIYRMSDRGGPAQNLTNSPDVDEFDAVWNKEGNRIAFVSDRAVDSEGRHHFDIWVMDLSQPDQPTQITTNPSHDDCPAWDPQGKHLYFRSNRGGEWSIWKVGL